MTHSDLLGIAAHLHVIMRRKMGRVTDTEWLAINHPYAHAMSTLALKHATDTQDEDLQRWASRLAQAWQERLKRSEQERPLTSDEDHTQAAKPASTGRRGQPEQRYVWGVRS